MSFTLYGAHSGFGGTPDGSLASIRAGDAAGFPVTEVDVQLTRDGIPVIHHDDSLPGVQALRISALSWDELTALRPDILLFSKALSLARSLGLSMNIDLKTPLAAEPCAALCVQTGMTANCHFSGLNPAQAPTVTAQHLPVRHLLNVPAELAGDPAKAVAKAVACGAFGLNLHHSLVTPKLVERVHRSFLWIWTWTVNDRANADRLAAMGVNGITTRGFMDD